MIYAPSIVSMISVLDIYDPLTVPMNGLFQQLFDPVTVPLYRFYHSISADL